MSFLFAAAIAASTATLPSCSWDRPGINPFMGDVAAAVDRYADIPGEVRAKLKARMAKRDYDEIATIRRETIEGKVAYHPKIRDMHFGAGQVCREVTRSRWSAEHAERGLVYCEGEHCIIVPTVCRNVSRITRLAPRVAGSEDVIGDEPVADLGDGRDPELAGSQTVGEAGTGFPGGQALFAAATAPGGVIARVVDAVRAVIDNWFPSPGRIAGGGAVPAPVVTRAPEAVIAEAPGGGADPVKPIVDDIEAMIDDERPGLEGTPSMPESKGSGTGGVVAPGAGPASGAEGKPAAPGNGKGVDPSAPTEGTEGSVMPTAPGGGTAGPASPGAPAGTGGQGEGGGAPAPLRPEGPAARPELPSGPTGFDEAPAPNAVPVPAT